MGTYPPRECGIATFTQDLFNGSKKILEGRAECKVCAMNFSQSDAYEYPPEVEWQIDQNSKREYASFARKINHDGLVAGVVLQHEYGIFGGIQGENILSFMQTCEKPITVTLHTVLPDPKPKMREVTKQIIARANALIVLTESSRQVLEKLYPEAVGKTNVIPHGIHDTPFAASDRYKTKLKLDKNIVLTTFGLLSKGKGIEYVIKALPQVVKKYPKVQYLVLGETHPVIRRKEGEKYRNKLIALVKELGLKKNVKFYDQYFSLPNLLFFLKATDIYISTSINPNQAVSGTLSYALGTGRAVISTDFAQAKEIINDKTGKLVPIEDSVAFSEAIIELLDQKDNLKHMHKYAYDTTRHMLWGNVAKEYMQLLSIYSPLIRTIEPVLPPLKLSHLRRMTDEFGLFQFASFSSPNKAFGYTIDDNARALIICSWLASHGKKTTVANLTKTYLEFIKKCQLEDGTFTNYLSHEDKKPTSQNSDENLEEANARALWALSEVMNNHDLSKKLRHEASKLFLEALPHTHVRDFIRSRAFIIKALVNAHTALPKHKDEFDHLIKKHADILVRDLKKHTEGMWTWFDSYLSYNNAILPESLFLAGVALKNPTYTNAGKVSLEFLIQETFKDDFYFPVGQSDWYRKGETRSEFDQQPEDPTSMILALVTAYKITDNDEYQHLAYKCFTWFLGNNILGVPLYNYKTGGCYDGLHPDRVNLNQGAESLVSYLMARIAMLELN